MNNIALQLGASGNRLECLVPGTENAVQFRLFLGIADIVAANDQNAILGHFLDEQALEGFVLEFDRLAPQAHRAICFTLWHLQGIDFADMMADRFGIQPLFPELVLFYRQRKRLAEEGP